MTISEFKAWLEGFSEGINDAPTPEQWAKVLEKIALLQAVSPAPYVPPYPPVLGPQRFYWESPITCETAKCTPEDLRCITISNTAGVA